MFNHTEVYELLLHYGKVILNKNNNEFSVCIYIYIYIYIAFYLFVDLLFAGAEKDLKDYNARKAEYYFRKHDSNRDPPDTYARKPFSDDVDSSDDPSSPIYACQTSPPPHLLFSFMGVDVVASQRHMAHAKSKRPISVEGTPHGHNSVYKSSRGNLERKATRHQSFLKSFPKPQINRRHSKLDKSKKTPHFHHKAKDFDEKEELGSSSDTEN